MYEQFAARAGLPPGATIGQIVDAVHAMPYGRATRQGPAGAVEEWRGTCSAKHALLAILLRERWPQLRPRLVHRVYRVGRQAALDAYGPVVAAAVPAEGLVDVHRHLVITVGGADVAIDVTFPAGPRWDGPSSMRLACGEGTDTPAGEDPDAGKAELVARHCDPVVREPFIAALAAASAARGAG